MCISEAEEPSIQPTVVTDHVIDSQLSRPIKIHQLDMSSRQLLALQWQLSAHNYAAKADDFMYSREDIFKRNFHFKIMYI